VEQRALRAGRHAHRAGFWYRSAKLSGQLGVARSDTRKHRCRQRLQLNLTTQRMLDDRFSHDFDPKLAVGCSRATENRPVHPPRHVAMEGRVWAANQGCTDRLQLRLEVYPRVCHKWDLATLVLCPGNSPSDSMLPRGCSRYIHLSPPPQCATFTGLDLRWKSNNI